MASVNLANLQATINRYADKADFSPIAIDGGMGPKTIEALRASLRSVGNDAFFQRARDWTDALDGASADDVRASAIMQGLADLNQLLAANADAAELPPPATVALVKQGTTTTIPDKSAFKITAPSTAGPIDKARLWFRQLSTPAQVGVGAAGIFGVFGIWGMIAKRKR